MSRIKQVELSKKHKLIIAVALALLITIIGGALWKKEKDMSQKEVGVPYSTVNASEGTLASSTLLSGTVKALSEEYIYFDASKGTHATVSVKVGDKVTKGQQLVQYNTSVQQAAYDSAVRSLNKIGRQINHLKTYGVPSATTETVHDEETGETSTTTVQPSAQQNANYTQQLQDLNDAYADAQAEVNKAQVALNDMIVVSGVSGTVVEANNDIDPSAKNSQTLVHVASEGQLQVRGSLTEHDLKNIKVGEVVKIKSKVYADQEWTGKISYVSNYPTDASAASNAMSSSGAGSTSTASTYDYKVDITSPLNELKQGFSVSVEVVNDAKHILLPLSALVDQDKKHFVWVYDDTTEKVKKVKVTLGNADGEHQEITSGIKLGDIVIANPDKKMKDGSKLKNVTVTDKKTSNDSNSKSKESEVKK
ncbi:efflux RND transporter periplasmic adaptor subunit [Streptococcus phocae subsp. salmonis]